MQQDSKSVVLEAGEAPTGPLDLLHAEVLALGRAVRCTSPVVVQDLLPPPMQGVAEGADLLDVVGPATGDGLVEQHGGVFWIVGEIDVTDRLLGQPRTEQLVVGITQPQPEQQAVVSSLVEPFGPLQQELSDPVERIVLPAPVAEGLVLDPPSHPVDAPVG